MTEFDRLLQASGMVEYSKVCFTYVWAIIQASPRPDASWLREQREDLQ